MSKRKKHIFFWVAIYLIWTYIKAGGFHTIWIPRFLLINLVNISIYMMAYYLLKQIQIPKFFNAKRYGIFALSLLGSTLILYIIWRLFGLWWIDEMRNFNPTRRFMNSVDYLTQSIQFYSPAMLLLVLDTQSERQQERDRIHQLEKEKMATELKFLKAQLNPHFLFNTLNNLYSYVVNNSPKAPEIILKLSSILDYVLYKSQRKNVSLKEEKDTIEHFIGLEKIRYGTRLIVDFRSEGDLSIPISPLILLSLVENAFKHGASGDIDTPKIDIEIIEKNKYIHCNIWNTKSNYQGELNDAYKEGIGLSNIKKQLDLSYPSRYKLELDDQQKTFAVALTINPE